MFSFHPTPPRSHEVCCCAKDCHYNTLHNGRFCCTLERVVIDRQGGCDNFITREEYRKIPRYNGWSGVKPPLVDIPTPPKK